MSPSVVSKIITIDPKQSISIMFIANDLPLAHLCYHGHCSEETICTTINVNTKVNIRLLRRKKNICVSANTPKKSGSVGKQIFLFFSLIFIC